MQDIFHEFREAHIQGSGPLLAATLSPVAPAHNPNRFTRFYGISDSASVYRDVRSGLMDVSRNDLNLSKGELTAWVDVYVAFWKTTSELCLVAIGNGNWTALYEAWRDVANALIKGYNGGWFEAWTVPCLYVVGKFLRVFAIKADTTSSATKEVDFAAAVQDDIATDLGCNGKLEDAARVINRVFTLCISDRAPVEESRRWGLYYTTNLLFKTYFKLNSVGLSKNILRALQASRVDMPPMEAFPKSHIVTFKYYVGVILFLEEDYERAEENLTDAFKLCHRDVRRNKELILTYLIPCRLLTSHALPSSDLLAPYSQLRALFVQLSKCIKTGDLAGFDAALAANEAEFVKRRIYLTLERGRDIALRNLLRKVYITGGLEEQKDGAPAIRRSRIPVAEFAAAIRIGTKNQGAPVDIDEVECLLANMIYKNLMKGYISHERGITVLSKGSAFPGTGV